jgi:ATPase family associated with various cellular activities (AAA)
MSALLNINALFSISLHQWCTLLCLFFLCAKKSSPNMYLFLASIFGGIAVALFHRIFEQIPWSCIFIFSDDLFGFKLYEINDGETCKRVQKRLKRWSRFTDGENGFGVSIGKWYYVSVSPRSELGGEGTRATIFSNASTFSRLTRFQFDENDHIDCSTSSCLDDAVGTKMYERSGSFCRAWYRERMIGIRTSKMVKIPSQLHIVDEVESHFCKNKHSVVMIHGPPGSGKSMVGTLIAERIKGSYCNTFQPWMPGETLSDLYSEASVSKTNPIVISFDEIDIVLKKVHFGLIKEHKRGPTSISSKSGWNRFFDDIGRGMYPHVVILLTSNSSPESTTKELDSSYLRKGRVDLIFALSDVLV